MRLIVPISLTLLTLLILLITSPTVQSAEQAARGGYLVSLLGCGRCHTEGHLTGNQPAGPHLAGSRIGIAYTAGTNPGLVFPSNLTPDPTTGIGGWSREEIIRAITRGTRQAGQTPLHERLTVMPWVNYRALNNGDLEAIADYLLSLPPIENPVPATVPEGTAASTEYVRFGVYRFSPHPRAEQ